MKIALEQHGRLLPADAQPTKVLEPRDRPLDREATLVTTQRPARQVAVIKACRLPIGYGFIIPSSFNLNMNLVLETGDISEWITAPVDLDEDSDADAIDPAALITAVANGQE